jgi:hypothetical protein
MKARHIAVVALSAFAAIAGSASAADGVIHSRTVLDGHPRHWEGSGIPSHLVRNDKPVVVSTDRPAQFGRDGAVSMQGAAPLTTGDAATAARVGREVPVATVRVKAPVTATPATASRYGRG